MPRKSLRHIRQLEYDLMSPNIGGGVGYRPWSLCGAIGTFTFRGVECTGICTRFKGHTEKAKKDPLRHFDERQKHGWYDEVPPAIDAGDEKG